MRIILFHNSLVTSWQAGGEGTWMFEWGCGSPALQTQLGFPATGIAPTKAPSEVSGEEGEPGQVSVGPWQQTLTARPGKAPQEADSLAEGLLSGTQQLKKSKEIPGVAQACWGR